MALVRQKALRSATWWIGVAILAIAVFAYLLSRDYGRAGTMPGVIALAIVGLAAVHTVYGLVFGVVANDNDWHDAAETASFARRRTIYAALAMVVVAGIWLVGFHATLPVFLFCFIAIATGRWVIGLLLALGIWAFTYIVLFQTLNIAFPSTVLQRWMIANGWY
ncbi:MAG: hypothetical protein CMH66_01915 [Nioella sp.]|nr:hypothetical protein [Nioella sp.]